MEQQFGHVVKSGKRRKITPIPVFRSFRRNPHLAGRLSLRKFVNRNDIAEIRPIGSLYFTGYQPFGHCRHRVVIRIFPQQFKRFAVYGIGNQQVYLAVGVNRKRVRQRRDFLPVGAIHRKIGDVASDSFENRFRSADISESDRDPIPIVKNRHISVLIPLF